MIFSSSNEECKCINTADDNSVQDDPLFAHVLCIVHVIISGTYNGITRTLV